MTIRKFLLKHGIGSPRSVAKTLTRLYSNLFPVNEQTYLSDRDKNLKLLSARKSVSMPQSMLHYINVKSLEDIGVVDLSDFMDVVLLIILCENKGLRNLLRFDTSKYDSLEIIQFAKEIEEIVKTEVQKKLKNINSQKTYVSTITGIADYFGYHSF